MVDLGSSTVFSYSCSIDLIENGGLPSPEHILSYFIFGSNKDRSNRKVEFANQCSVPKSFFIIAVLVDPSLSTFWRNLKARLEKLGAVPRNCHFCPSGGKKVVIKTHMAKNRDHDHKVKFAHQCWERGVTEHRYKKAGAEHWSANSTLRLLLCLFEPNVETDNIFFRR